MQLLQRGSQVATALTAGLPLLDSEDLEDWEDAPDEEAAATEGAVLDRATAARTVEELAAEIESLRRLETLAQAVRRSGEDRKWQELTTLLHKLFAPATDGAAEGFVASPQQKLVIFTEHRDTLNYLYQRITTLLGREDAVVMIHGGVRREDRRRIQASFLHDPQVQILLANDAAAEGINLQRAHLMVNYDLPWNPNRIEQRFGRIHRIGQTEVCHLWNLIATETREGDVYHTLLQKLEEARRALGGQVFDVLGKVQFEGKAAARPAAGSHPVRRAARSPGPADPGGQRGLRPGTGAGPPRGVGLGPGLYGHQPGAPHPGGHGARRGQKTATALHRVVFQRGLPAAGRPGAGTGTAALPDQPRPGPGARAGPADRPGGAGPAAL